MLEWLTSLFILAAFVQAPAGTETAEIYTGVLTAIKFKKFMKNGIIIVVKIRTRKALKMLNNLIITWGKFDPLTWGKFVHSLGVFLTPCTWVIFTPPTR